MASGGPGAGGAAGRASGERGAGGAHEDLLHRVWGPTRPGSVQVIRTQLMRLRQKLGEDSENPTYIFAEPRVGYRMAEGERTYG